MFNSPTRRGFSLTPRPMFNPTKEKMSAPNNAYYVLTQAHEGLPNSVLFNTVGDARYLRLNGSNANTILNIGSQTITTTYVPVNEIDYTNKAYVDNVAARSEIDVFLTENASDIGGYFDLEVNVITATKEDIVQSITANSTTLIASFASILGEAQINEIRLLESGIYALHIHAEGQVINNLLLYCEFYKRTSGGVETLLGTSHDSSILTTSEAEYDVHASITFDTLWVSGDRFIIKVYGRNNGAAAKNITIYMEGETATRAEFPGFISLGNFLLKNGSNADVLVDIGGQSFKSTGVLNSFTSVGIGIASIGSLYVTNIQSSGPTVNINDNLNVVGNITGDGLTIEGNISLISDSEDIVINASTDNAVNIIGDNGVSIFGQFVIESGSITMENVGTVNPGIEGRLWVDGNRFLKVSDG